MSEESSGPMSPPHQGREVCVVICNGDDPDGCNSGETHPCPPAADSADALHAGDVGASQKVDKDEDEDDDQDCQEQAMLQEEEEASRSGGTRCSRKDSRKQQDRESGHPQHSATFGVAADDDEDELPFPGFVPQTFYYFHQRHPLRFACLRLITWPYPFWYCCSSAAL